MNESDRAEVDRMTDEAATVILIAGCVLFILLALLVMPGWW
jgi:hypothetical protein